MTVSASTNRQFTIDQHVTLAYRTAGLVTVREQPSEEQLAEGRDFLEVIVDSLNNYGIFAKALQFVEVPLVDGTRVYELPENVQEIRGNGMLIQAADVGVAPNYGVGETVVNQVASQDWALLGDKTSTGQPSQFWIDRQPDGPVEAYFWPVPDATMDGAVVRMQALRHLADCDEGAATLDLEVSWNKYLMFELAAQLALANSRPMDRVQWYKGLAENELPRARAKATASFATQMVYDHGGRCR